MIPSAFYPVRLPSSFVKSFVHSIFSQTFQIGLHTSRSAEGAYHTDAISDQADLFNTLQKANLLGNYHAVMPGPIVQCPSKNAAHSSFSEQLQALQQQVEDNDCKHCPASQAESSTPMGILKDLKNRSRINKNIHLSLCHWGIGSVTSSVCIKVRGLYGSCISMAPSDIPQSFMVVCKCGSVWESICAPSWSGLKQLPILFERPQEHPPDKSNLWAIFATMQKTHGKGRLYPRNMIVWSARRQKWKHESANFILPSWRLSTFI